jgi:excinuclease UvrABC ATPase subunit
MPTVISVRGARQNNLRDIDVDVPLWRTVAVVGVSGSGKTSLAMGTLYAEGLQRFPDGLSTYSRRRLTQAQRPDVERIDHLPRALALRERPPIPGPRSTVGTMSEVPNVLRLMMSRLGTHRCPNGHLVGPSVDASNSHGGWPACRGLGVRSEVDTATLVRYPDKTIEQGAILPWNSAVRRLSTYAAGELGVRLNVPYRSLTERERRIVLYGEPARRSSQRGVLYVFDEPSTGLHPLDVSTLVGVFDRPLDAGATIIVIDHDLDLLAAADHLIDMGPGGWAGRKDDRRGRNAGRCRREPGQRDWTVPCSGPVVDPEETTP